MLRPSDAPGNFQALPSATRRYGRLEICATGLGARRTGQAAFTRLDLLCVLLALSLCAAVVLPALASSRPRSQRVMCANNLRQIGQAFHLWGDDQGNRLPFEMPTAAGGTALHLLAVNVWLHYSWLSNELNSAAVLLCPSDTGRPARDFSADPAGGYLHPNFANAATSYILAHGRASSPLNVVSADRNIGYDGSGGCSIFRQSRVINTAGGASTSFARWTAGLHSFSGNLLRRDGSVVQSGRDDLARTVAEGGDIQDNGSFHYIAPR